MSRRRTFALSALLLAGLAAGKAAPPRTRTTFAVLSDPHLHDASALGASGPAFEAYVARDRKLLVQSEEILDSALAGLALEKPEFLLICGDLTKDGERVNHLLMASKLAALAARGIRTYVVPGNHDIANPEAVSYRTAPPTAAATVSAADFKAIYAGCGYGTALSQDPGSLSYLAEPVPGLWLFALDACTYDRNLPGGRAAVAGRLRASTLAWLEAHLALARSQGKVAIGMMHHNLVEHFRDQDTWYPEYLVKDFRTLGRTLADGGMGLVFTGHFHANDIAVATFGTSRIFDCETGSTITAPCPYRLVDLDLARRTAAISTRHVTSIPSRPADFPVFARAFLATGLADLAAAPHHLPAREAERLSPFFGEAMAAHCAGDEAPDPALRATLDALAGSADPARAGLGRLMLALWNDGPPADNDVTLRLE